MLAVSCVLIGHLRLSEDTFAKSGDLGFRLGEALHTGQVVQMFKVNGTGMDVSGGISQGHKHKYCTCVCKFVLTLNEVSVMGAVIFPKEAFHSVDSTG